MKCKVCNSEFEGRSDAKYCSAKCRVAANRNKSSITVAESVTDNVTANLSAKPKFAGFEIPNGFASLPSDVRNEISRISDDPEEFRRRVIIALDYQKKFPNSQHRGIDPDVGLPEGCKSAEELGFGELNPVIKPGDEAYVSSGVVEHCVYCGRVLPELESPRKGGGVCLQCSVVKVGHTGHRPPEGFE